MQILEITPYHECAETNLKNWKSFLPHFSLVLEKKLSTNLGRFEKSARIYVKRVKPVLLYSWVGKGRCSRVHHANPRNLITCLTLRISQNQCCGSGPGSVCIWASGSASGSVSHKYGSGSGSFHNQANIVRKTLIFAVLWLLYDFFPVFRPASGSRSVGSICFWASRIRIWIRQTEVRIRGSGSASGSVPKCHGSTTLLKIYLKDDRNLSQNRSNSKNQSSKKEEKYR